MCIVAERAGRGGSFILLKNNKMLCTVTVKMLGRKNVGTAQKRLARPNIFTVTVFDCVEATSVLSQRVCRRFEE